jgi:hypothetical protein
LVPLVKLLSVVEDLLLPCLKFQLVAVTGSRLVCSS